MISLVDIADRMRNGPKMASKDWDMALFRNISELVKKYEVKAYPTLIILSPKGKIIAKKVGYLSVKDIVAFINEAKNTL